jgi:fermentation-respiration switch protein FrsA (DUF1100 family)
MIDVVFLFLLVLLVILLIPLGTYLLYCLYFYQRQSSLLYIPRIPFEMKTGDRTIAHHEITYRTGDGIAISAWYVPAEKKEPGSGRVILFCHGNAGNITQRIDSFKIFRKLGLNTFIFDYRGYGRSEGKPTEKGTYLDGEGAWNYLVNVMKVKPEDIIIFGRSLGGGIASYLAQKYRPRALIIESSFTSVQDVASALFPRLPMRWLTRFKYDTRERLKEIRCPVMIIHSPDDELIPFRLGQVLYETANPPKVFLQIKGKHYHGFLNSRGIYTDGLREFITGITRGLF